MELAIELAEQGRGKTSPNPFVGAVVVKEGKVIGTGFTKPYGDDHAEVQALKNCIESPQGADLYVTLEPCSHYGKTPPCAEAIIKAGIKNVYAGIRDPNPKVDGNGFETLRQANVNVEYPFCENIISKQLEYYLHWVVTGKPFVILKNAVSLDGKIAANNGSSKWITNELSRNKVHQLRHEVDAVVTTINTVKQDNPILNVRLDEVYKHPIRVILDPHIEIDPNSNICKTASEYQTIIFYDNKMKLEAKHCELAKQSSLLPVNCEASLLDFDEILTALGR